MAKNKKTKVKATTDRRKNQIGFFKSIRFKLIAGLALPVIGIIVVGIFSYNKAASAVINNQASSSEETVSSIGTYLSLATETIQSRYKTYLNNEELKQYFSGIYDVMENDPNKKENVRKTYQTEMFDNVNADNLLADILFICDEHASFGTNTITSDTPYSSFMETEQGKAVNASQFAFHWFGNNNTADSFLGTGKDVYAIRLVRKLNNQSALMIIDIKMSTVMESLDVLDVGKGGYVALVTSDGAEIFSTDSQSDTAVFSDKSFYAKAMESEEISGSIDTRFNNENYKFIYSKIEGTGLTVCALISENHLATQVSDIQFITILIVIFSVIVSAAIAIILAGGISNSIKHLVTGLNGVADGDLTTIVAVKRNDEFKLITDAVNDTVTQVKHLISGVQDVNSELLQAANDVYDSSKLFLDTSNTIKGSIEEIKSGTGKLDEDSDNCLSQMDMLSEKIQTVTSYTDEIGRTISTTNLSINAGVTSIENVTETTSSTTKITGEVISAIEELQDKSRSIVDIVQTINDIAKQTNLLSLNASIEAARAGESGRGFAVVATEISKLAEQSLNSSGKITSIIDEILNETNRVVSIAKEAFDIVQQQNSSVTETTDAFKEMKHNIDILLTSLDDITHNVSNIESARKTTLASIESISSISAETSANSASVAETAETQNNAIESLSHAASALTDKSSQLSELLQKFKV